MATRSREDVDFSVVRPAAQRVGIDAEQAAGLAEGEPVAALARSGLSRNTVNLGESGRADQRSFIYSPDAATVSPPAVALAISPTSGSRTA
jgi:hypothetical protein